LSTECAPSGTSPQGNKAPFGSGSIGPGTGTTALPLAAMALSQKWYTGRGDKAGGKIGSTHLRAARPEIAVVVRNATQKGMGNLWPSRGPPPFEYLNQRVAIPKSPRRGNLEITNGSFLFLEFAPIFPPPVREWLGSTPVRGRLGSLRARRSRRGDAGSSLRGRSRER